MILKTIKRKAINFLINPRLIRNYLNFLYRDSSKDYNNNIDILSKYFKINIIEELKKINFDIYNEKDSWHYVIFKFLSFNFNPKTILEIGTYKGEFTNYLSKIFLDSKIHTIDLPHTLFEFENSYNRKGSVKEFLLKRDKNIQRDNVIFNELNSFFLIDEYFKNKFDLIWVDGHHHDPQVSIDIISSIKLIKKHGLIIIDDIVKKKFKDEYVSNESYQFLKKLKKQNIIEFDLIVKKITKDNFYLKKYIAIVKVNSEYFKY